MAMTRKTGGSSGRSFELFDELMPVRRYKLLLQTFLKRRGTGSRQTIAEALGHSRGFVTQITSPAYDLAISAAQVRAILRVGELTPEEERTFLAAYVAAHPERAADVYANQSASVAIAVPVLDDPDAQVRMEALIRKLAEDVIESFMAGQTRGEP